MTFDGTFRGPGRPKGTSGPQYRHKRTRARVLAREKAFAKAEERLPLKFKGNSLALLQVVYADTSLDIKTRIDAAGKALPYEVARPEIKQDAPDVVPLHERLKEYARERSIQASDGKVVEMRGK